MIGKIQRVTLREVWKHEAHDFTIWLEGDVHILGRSLRPSSRRGRRRHEVAFGLC